MLKDMNFGVSCDKILKDMNFRISRESFLTVEESPLQMQEHTQ